MDNLNLRCLTVFSCIFLSTRLLFASDPYLTSTAIRRIIIPHTCDPGYVVTSIGFVGQTMKLESTASDLINCPFHICNVSSLFSILPNGELVTISQIYHLLGRELRFSVRSELGKEMWIEDFLIRIKDGDDMLIFTEPVYEGHIFEDGQPFSPIRDLEDFQAKISRRSRVVVHYSLMGGPMDLFEIVETKNVPILRTLSSLDYEQETQYSLLVMASTNDMDDQPAFAKVIVFVENVNDNFPSMTQSSYHVTIGSSLSTHAEILNVTAVDADGDKVLFHIEGGRDNFAIHPQNGSVYLLRPSHELYTDVVYSFNVYAADTDGLKSKPASVNITVLQGLQSTLDSRKRRAIRPVKYVVIQESFTSGDILGLDNDHHNVFSFKEPSPRILELNPTAGTIKLRAGEKFDYEREKEIEFVIQIANIEDPSHLEEQPVIIRLKDVNDEIPEFKNVPVPFLTTLSASVSAGKSVYQLLAEDVDEGSVVKYSIESGGEDRFEVDSKTGVVRTRGTQSFPRGKEYEIGVAAYDTSVEPHQKSATHSLKILVGERDPQFFETQYTASVPESATERFEIIQVRAMSHQGYPISYELTTESDTQSNEFAIDQSSGIVDLLRILDYEKDPHQYHLKVKAIDNGRPLRTSTVNLIISLTDMNDNIPTFPLSQYIVSGIAETVSIGTDIMQVTATDLDSGMNSQLVYTVNHECFTVQTLNNIGYIKTAKRLDYDRMADHTYNFTIVATDKGNPAHSGFATVRVSVTNVNDEDPVFLQPVEHVQVSEDAPTSTVVHVVQAFDPDGDDVTFGFQGGRLVEGPFKIDPKSGIITLIRMLEKAKISYWLNITATDNGRCCGGTTTRHSRGAVVIEIKDINNNAPRFTECFTYNPVVMEKENVGTIVIKVTAQDLDTGPNGNVVYSLVKSNDQSSDRFEINPVTGVIRTADVFDREAQIGITDYGVTVKAEDQGSQTLAGFCTFSKDIQQKRDSPQANKSMIFVDIPCEFAYPWIKIGDKNDNSPVFNLQHYSTSLEESSVPGKRVRQVYATDRDAGENGKVEYFLSKDPSGFFSINQATGWITVARPMAGTNHVQLEVEARDKGPQPNSAFVNVDIEITKTVNAYPQWSEDYSIVYARISENAPVNTEVKRLRATSSIPDSLVNYVIQPGETPEQNGQPRSFHFRIDDATNDMILLTYKPLDYEAIPRYILTIKAANRATNSLHNDTRLTVDLIDENDEIPQFIGLDENGRYPGSVAENLQPGAEVITVTATDKDQFADYKKIYYRIKEVGLDHDKFSIDRNTGLIRSVASFDREIKNEYYVTVIAEDGAPSDRPNHYPPGTPNQEMQNRYLPGTPNQGEAEVQIRVTDMNDNTPYFKEKVYMARVPENTDPGSTIITVTAEDKDEENRLTYSITSGNEGNAFEVVSELGEIKVRGHLDYENGLREYQLTYRVFDDKYANTTIVRVQVLDVNDNPPRFDNAIYNVTDLQEEELGISKNNPKYLLTVRATDPDFDRNSNIRYSLTGQFADDGTFIVNEHTGEIYLTRALDRDQPWGRPVWNFNVLAHDEPDPLQPSLTGYAEVRVMPKDINDNMPMFDKNRLVGKVPEHSRAGVAVLTVIATDVDNGNNGSVTYSLKEVPMLGSQPLFSIDSRMGLISTLVNNALDREVLDKYIVVVQAKDRGNPSMSSSASVTIMVDDINDHSPKFTQKIFHATMSEDLEKGASITSVYATDEDVGPNAKLTYTLKEQDREHFYISSVEVTNTGVLKVFRPVDFDSLVNPFFNITVHVQDTDYKHMDTAYIEVKVTDYNDNPPLFVPNSKKVTIYEDVIVGTTLHRFSATDKDTGVNRQFTFDIDRQTDEMRQFLVDSNGLVTTNKALDRETVPGHRIHILAIDKGSPPQTGTGTLIISLMDVNDNYPEFARDYRPVIYENESPSLTVVIVSAIDRDTALNGPPFEFWLPPCVSCPCEANPTCADFAFKFLPGGSDNGYGAGIVTSLKTFDRERQKEYLMPIIMKDNGHPPITGTNTLTIIIGDINDNEHFPGHKNIFVYTYRGAFQNMPLGNVYAEDKDDWDVFNKTFTFSNAREAETFFRLDHETGEVYNRRRLPEGDYTFYVKVYDAVWKKSVESSVTVTVKILDEEAVINSGSVRIEGITAEEFIERQRTGPATTDYGQSKYDLLQDLLAKQLNVPLVNVQLFTVRNHPTLKKTIDIRYAAHGSPYYRSSKLDGLLITNKQQIEKSLGLRIVMVPIDECGTEHCEGGGCRNRLVTINEPHLINTNGSSLVGLMTYIEAECSCEAWPSGEREKKCSADSCLNGGTCVESLWGIECQCRPDFNGPRCQQTHHGFTGESWAWFPPLSQCEEAHTSFEFITTNENGVLLYNGPMGNVNPGEVEDFIMLELRAGYPVLRLNYGSGELRLHIDGRDSQGHRKLNKLNSGHWHRIDILRHGKEVRLIVDRCESANIEENPNMVSSTEDRKACEVVGEVQGNSRFLNINTPLQLGGRANVFTNFPQNAMKDGLNGCIKNFKHNGMLYDLHTGSVGEHKDSHDGCHRERVVCGREQNEVTGQTPHCGRQGECVGSFYLNDFTCRCHSGWRGENCDIQTTVRDFQRNSFIEWQLNSSFHEELRKSSRSKNNIHLMFRTRNQTGLLFKAQNSQESEFIALEVEDYRIVFRYNLGSGENILTLSHINVSDGAWHTVRVDRIGRWVELKLDGGEGRFYNKTFGKPGDHVEIILRKSRIFSGGDVKFPSSDSPPLISNDYENGCMNDIRLNDHWFPMKTSENSEDLAATYLDRSQNLGDGCDSEACLGVGGLVCERGLQCVDLWRHAECRCPAGMRLAPSISMQNLCVNIDECQEDPFLCYNGECHDTEGGYYCECFRGYGGPDCLERRGLATVFISTSASFVIIGCALIVLVIVLLFLACGRRRSTSYTAGVDPNDDVRENIIRYDEDGMGEDDQNACDMTKLKNMNGKKPGQQANGIKRIDLTQHLNAPHNRYDATTAGNADIGVLLRSRLLSADYDPNAPPYDSVREYAYEGMGSPAGSLSSLTSTDSDNEDWDQLNNWGPRFQKLTDIFNSEECNS